MRKVCAQWRREHPEKVRQNNTDWYLANREEAKAKAAAWRAKNPEQAKKSDKAKRLAKPEQYREMSARRYWADPNRFRKAACDWYRLNMQRAKNCRALYRKTNVEKVRTAHAKWHRDSFERRKKERREHPEKYRQYCAARRARILACTIGDPKSILAFYRKVRTARRIKCRWCKKWVEKGDRHVDHILPLSRGGAHALFNLCCACSTCNHRKLAKLPQEFIKEIHMAKKQKLKLLLNIGKLDADQLGLDHSLEGESVTVDEKTAEILVKNGWASKSGELDPEAVLTSPSTTAGIASRPGVAEITSDLTAGTSAAASR
jgi:5-methylcytosine-specific restriction endonuclease McrA